MKNTWSWLIQWPIILLDTFFLRKYQEFRTKLLPCQSGVWKKASGSASNGFFSSGYSINEQCPIAWLPHATCTQVNRITGGCSCPGGTSAVLVTKYQASSCNNGINVGIINGYVYTCQ